MQYIDPKFDFDITAENRPTYLKKYYGNRRQVINNETQIKKLFKVKGRVNRSSWWQFQAATILFFAFSIVLISLFLSFDGTMRILFNMLLVPLGTSSDQSIVAIYLSTTGQMLFSFFLSILTIVWLFWLLLYLINTIKRLHDLDISGFAVLILIFPFIGWVILLTLCGFIKGEEYSNQYGRNPNKLT